MNFSFKIGMINNILNFKLLFFMLVLNKIVLKVENEISLGPNWENKRKQEWQKRVKCRCIMIDILIIMHSVRVHIATWKELYYLLLLKQVITFLLLSNVNFLIAVIQLISCFERVHTYILQIKRVKRISASGFFLRRIAFVNKHATQRNEWTLERQKRRDTHEDCVIIERFLCKNSCKNILKSNLKNNRAFVWSVQKKKWQTGQNNHLHPQQPIDKN